MQLSGVFMCHHKKCRIERMWELMRGGKRARCTGCGDVYPCRGSCEHLDCADTRKELKLEDDEPVTVREAGPQVEHALPLMVDDPAAQVEVTSEADVERVKQLWKRDTRTVLTPEEKRERDRARVAAWRAAKKGKTA